MLTVVHRQRLTPNVVSLTLEGRLSPAMKSRRAGQFLSLQTPLKETWSAPHPYTISSPPEREELELTVKTFGTISTQLQSLPVGTTVAVQGPYGTFCKNIEKQRSILMIAGGIGITPFLSVLRHLRRNGYDGDIVLFWGCETWQDFFALDRLRDLTGPLSLWVVLVCPLQIDQTIDTSDRLVFLNQGHLCYETLQTYSDVTGSKIYLCGSYPMRTYITQQLHEHDIQPSSIEIEQFGVFQFASQGPCPSNPISEQTS